MIPVTQAFSSTYREARARFLEAAGAAGLRAQSHEHPLKGIEGETLAMDVVRDGPDDAARVLLVSSACHGIEGYCGSGVQVFALHDDEWRAKARDAGVAVLYIHALNPWGFSFGQRTTHENVDLNRNFHDYSQPLPDNPAYRELHPHIVPSSWPPSAEHEAAIAAFIATRGMPAYQSAVSQGQHEFPDGVHFGGTAPTWSNQTLRAVLREHGRKARRLAWIDIHTGLGPSGVGERIYAGPDNRATEALARSWWAQDGNHVTSIYDGSSTSAFLTGLMWQSAEQECPQAEYTGLAMEYGTEPLLEVFAGVRAGNWLLKHPEADAALTAKIRAQVRRAFYTETDVWKGQIISQARQALFQAASGLSR